MAHYVVSPSPFSLAKGYGYSKSHEYASVGESSGLTVIGISQYAQVCGNFLIGEILYRLSSLQEKLGDVVYAELPEVDSEMEKGGNNNAVPVRPYKLLN